jgi:legumain
MKPAQLLIAAALLLTLGHCANWAVLVAGSDGFYNYRHQSDVFHAYQALLAKGMDPDKIIVLAYDDIVRDPSNPFPGKIFNKPTYKDPGVDVYAGVKIDYKGSSVTPKIFEAVLTGDTAAVAGKGSGKVLNTTSADNIFIFFSDHGAVGIIAFPNEYLYAKDLLNTFALMKGRYNKLVFYLETCESGSMFVNLPKDANIYALSAAGTSESSWATYCSPDDVIQGKHIGTCLGDLFSVSFIEDIDLNDISAETLQAQFEKVKKLTSLSVVMQWGDVSYTRDVVSTFISKGMGAKSRSLKRNVEIESASNSKTLKPYFIKLNYLTGLYKREPTTENLNLMME